MKKALVVDWLDKYGGAERVIAVLHKTFNFSKSYALTNVMNPDDLLKVYGSKSPIIQTTFLQYFGSFFRVFFFLFPFFIKRIKIDSSVQTILSSSHAVAKGAKKTSVKQVHISYFQARNFKYIWEDAPLYFGKSFFIVKPFVKYLQKIDIKQAQNPDFIICNSKFVQQWVKNKYNRDSVVIYPPVDLQNFPLQAFKEDYYVAVGRIVAYKRFDLIVDAFVNSNKRLIILGDGPELNSLKKKASNNISFTGFVDSEQVQKYISKAKAFIHIGVEDFGIAPIEAQSCGTPVIAYKAGGVLETIIDEKTGILFEEQSKEALIKAIEKFESLSWNTVLIHEHAQNFSEERFVQEIKICVTNYEKDYFRKTN